MKQTASTLEHPRALHEDPLSGEHGAHPIGVGVGTAIGGAAIGAMAGAAGGPVGAAIGAVAGGVAGGLTGKAVAESIDPTVEEDYWRTHHQLRPYYSREFTYEDYAPAYRYGWEARAQHPDRTYEELEEGLARNWEMRRAQSRLDWSRAQLAVRDGWERVEE